MTPAPHDPASLSPAHFNMIYQQIRPWEVLDIHVLHALGRVPRDAFVPPAHRAQAFADLELPLTPTQTEGLCMLAPKVQARLLQDLALKPTDKVLDIGTGSGYMSALLADLAQEVVSVEINPDLAQTARQTLQTLGISKVHIHTGDACAEQFALCKAHGPFDAIVLNGSVAKIPAPLRDLLAPGGRLVAIVGNRPIMRATTITCVAPGIFHHVEPWDTVAPRLQNFPETRHFEF